MLPLQPSWQHHWSIQSARLKRRNPFRTSPSALSSLYLASDRLIPNTTLCSATRFKHPLCSLWVRMTVSSHPSALRLWLSGVPIFASFDIQGNTIFQPRTCCQSCHSICICTHSHRPSLPAVHLGARSCVLVLHRLLTAIMTGSRSHRQRMIRHRMHALSCSNIAAPDRFPPMFCHRHHLSVDIYVL